MGLRVPRVLPPSSALPREPLPVVRGFKVSRRWGIDRVTKWKVLAGHLLVDISPSWWSLLGDSTSPMDLSIIHKSYLEISLFWSTGSIQHPFFSPLLYPVLFIAFTIFLMYIYIYLYIYLAGSESSDFLSVKANKIWGVETTGVAKHAIHAGWICAPMGGEKCPNFRTVQTEFSLNQ